MDCAPSAWVELPLSSVRMTKMTPEQHGITAMHHLEKAVVAVLREAKRQDLFVGPSFVSRRTGIYSGDQHNDNIVHAILHKLLSEGRVQRGLQPNGRRGWALTDTEVAQRHSIEP